MKTVNAPITLLINRYETNVTDLLVGETALGQIVTEAMLNRYSLEELNCKGQGQLSMFNRVMRNVIANLETAVKRNDLYNYFAKQGKRTNHTEYVHTINDSEVEDAKIWAELELAK